MVNILNLVFIMRNVKTLIIAEKRNAAQRIAYILSNGNSKFVKVGRGGYFKYTSNGDEYFVVPLRGHIVELDYGEEFKRWDINKLIELVNEKPRKINKERGIVKILWDIAKDVDEIIIATDYDREGELIGVEALSVIEKKYGKKFKVKRAKFSALTKQEIEKAFNNLVDINYNLASAAEARQHIDLAWGASLTRFVSIASGRRGREFLSVGRVQSPTLALIVKREEEIENFKPKKYWELTAKLQKKMKFEAKHEKNPFWEEEEVNKILAKIEGAKIGKVHEVKVENKEIYSPPPFDTTTFLSEATKLGFSAAKAMKIAEDLYMGGYISYPRTDNTVYPRSLNINSILKSLESSKFGEEVKRLQGEQRKYPTRGKKETKDHPPIVPVRGAKLSGERGKIYELIVRRFLATLAKNGVYEDMKARIDIKGEPFIAHGRSLIEEGWLHYYPYTHFEEKKLPPLKDEMEVKVIEIVKDEKQTQPPKRYTQSSLLKEMEKLNLGTKSTRAEIIQKLFDRGYVTGNPLRPTDVGRALIGNLTKHDVDVVRPEMTAKLEEDMDKIEKGEKSMDDVINESKEMLTTIIKKLNDNKGEFGDSMKSSMQRVIGECDGGKLIYYPRKKLVVCDSDNKKFYYLPSTGYVEFLDEKCPICGLPLIKVIRKGQSPDIRCLDPKCEYNKKKDVVGKCPKCGGDLVIRQSRNGKRFIGCSNYPKCDVTYPLPQKGQVIPTGETCCNGAPVVIIRKKGRKDWKICVDMNCKEENKDSGKKSKK